MKRNIGKEEKVFIISQYTGETPDDIRMNIEFARAIAKQVYAEDKLPIVPHLYFPQFLDDSSEDERKYGIKAGHWMMWHCNSVLMVTVDHVVSRGMEEDYQHAIKLGLEIETINFTEEERDMIAGLI